VASLAAAGDGWVVAANDYGRLATLALMAPFGIALLLPGLPDRLMRPLVALGARLSQSAAIAVRNFAPLAQACDTVQRLQVIVE
jgi:hypothetical protein